jgi:hypothetical protein
LSSAPTATINGRCGNVASHWIIASAVPSIRRSSHSTSCGRCCASNVRAERAALLTATTS